MTQIRSQNTDTSPDQTDDSNSKSATESSTDPTPELSTIPVISETTSSSSSFHLELQAQVRFQAPCSGRLDHLIRNTFTLSHKKARKLITTGKIKVRSRTQSQWETQVNQNDWVEVNLNASNPKKKEVFKAALVHQDDSFVVISSSWLP